jgi:hypothetical protein
MCGEVSSGSGCEDDDLCFRDDVDEAVTLRGKLRPGEAWMVQYGVMDTLNNGVRPLCLITAR